MTSLADARYRQNFGAPHLQRPPPGRADGFWFVIPSFFLMRPFVLATLLLLLLTTGGCASMKRAALKQALLYGLTPEQKEFVKRETAPGGKLDFVRNLAANPSLGVLGNVGLNQRELGLQLWGQAVKKLGVDNADHAVALYEEVTATKLAAPQRQALRNGYAAKE